MFVGLRAREATQARRIYMCASPGAHAAHWHGFQRVMQHGCIWLQSRYGAKAPLVAMITRSSKYTLIITNHFGKKNILLLYSDVKPIRLSLSFVLFFVVYLDKCLHHQNSYIMLLISFSSFAILAELCMFTITLMSLNQKAYWYAYSFVNF